MIRAIHNFEPSNELKYPVCSLAHGTCSKSRRRIEINGAVEGEQEETSSSRAAFLAERISVRNKRRSISRIMPRQQGLGLFAQVDPGDSGD